METGGVLYEDQDCKREMVMFIWEAKSYFREPSAYRGHC